MSLRLFLVATALMGFYVTAQAKLGGTIYEPFGPEDDLCLGKKKVASDLKAIAKVAKSIRLKSVATCFDSTIQILNFAKKNKMTVALGVFISDDQDDNTSELKMFRELLKDFDGKVIERVIVGDEVSSTSKVTDKMLARYINRVKGAVKKAGMKIPVGTGEAWNVLEFSKELNATMKASQFLCMNFQPYWGGISARCEDSDSTCVRTGMLVDQKAEVISFKTGKDVIICNGGWPTMGEECCGIEREGSLDGFGAIPSVNGLQSFLDELHAATTESGRKYFIGDAFDAEWKRKHVPCDDCLGLSTEFGCGAKKKKNRECEVGYHFGLHTADGKLKKLQIPE